MAVLGCALLCANQLTAQTYAETALLFSRTVPGGSARIQSMGGAQVSLGGDYSSAYSNPAGLGMFNRSEFTVTPSLNFANVNADYLGTSTTERRTTPSLSGFSFVFHNDDDRGGFLGGSFAITYNRINDFNRNLGYSGSNNDNSIIDYFIEEANGGTPDQFERDGDLFNTVTELAYNNYLIGESTIQDPDNDPTQYFTDVLGVPFQLENFERRRAQNQWTVAYGANFTDRFFLGASLGLTSLRYRSTKTFRESFENEPLDNLSLREDLEISGSGINFSLGGIYRPIDRVQLGVSFSTPTYYQLTDTYSASMSTRWNNFEYLPGEILNDESASTDFIVSEYNLRTPTRLGIGATYFFGKNGFVTADVERMNFSRAKYSSGGSGISYSEDNEDISTLYQSVTNVRVGGEFRLENYRFRGGYAFMPDPFQNEQNEVNRSIQRLTAGIGYRTQTFFVDLALVYSLGENSYRPYTVNTPTSPVVTYDQKNTSVLLTVGFPF